jgi:hypothetical protein
MADSKKETCNTDIHSICRRVNRFIAEVNKSQSSGISQTMPFDVSRIQSYVKSLRSYMTHIVAQPLLDLPETGPQAIPLPADEPMPRVENESAYDLCMLFSLMRDELANSQSSRLSTNLGKFDYDRAVKILDKVDSLLAYIAAAEPLDLPESSPRESSSGMGSTGI